MEKYLPLLQKSPLFSAMAPGEILSVLHCVGAAVREVGAGEYILPAGSPILQDGRLIGAVTHVLVNRPEQGYGIFLQNMLTQCEAYQ